MISEIWQKKLVCLAEIDPNDSTSEVLPLPLIFNASWHHYIGTYYNLIQEHFMFHAPFPYDRSEFWVQLLIEGEDSISLSGTQIIGHLYNLYLQQKEPEIHLICHFRIEKSKRSILSLFNHYKNNLKASTAIRYGKFGASVITVDMSVSNIQNMFKNYCCNNLSQFLGDLEEDSDKLGFKYIISQQQKIENIAVRIISKQFQIERSCPKEKTLQEFLTDIFDQNFKIRTLKLHGVVLPSYNFAIKQLDQYCHPDGYLYFII